MEDNWEEINLLFPNKPKFNINNNLLIFGCPNFLCHKNKSLLLEDSNEDGNEEANKQRNDV